MFRLCIIRICLWVAFAACLAVPGNSQAQADTSLLASIGGNPGLALQGKAHPNKRGAYVSQHRLTLTSAQAATLGLMLYTGGADSLDVKLTAAEGLRPLQVLHRRISAKDLLLLPPNLLEPADCGTTAPCKPNRIVVEFRLAAEPQRRVWVCQVVLQAGD